MPICSVVVILLTKTGLISYGTDIIDKVIMPISIIKSLLMTITVSQPGIKPKIDKDIKLVDKSILSANGSRKAPNSVCLLSNLASSAIQSIG